MRSTRRATWHFGRSVSATIFFLLLTLTGTMVARAAPDDADDGDDYDVKARVVRISLITGDVNLKRSGNTDWERVRLNFALVEGDTIATDRDSRVEIQIDARNFVRLGANSVLKIATLRDEGVALSVVEGTASVRLAKFDHDHEYFEIDAPKTTLAAEKKGLYRIDVSREGRVRLSARDGGRARIYSETSGFALRDGRSAELIFEGADAGDWEFVAVNAADSWDNWINERERFLAQRLRYDTQYYDNAIWGAEDLDAYGDWTYANDYGWVWRPHATVINNYNNWAPYRYGSWCWISPYGWTWVGNEPWGWAPYHFGRWVYYNNYWAWCPRSHYYRHRSWWRPALVVFNISFGDNVCWYPLRYHQRDPRSRYYQAHDNRLRPLRADEIARLQRVNPAQYRAVSTMPAKDFGGDGRTRPADDTVARRVISAEPLRTDLPIRPAYAAGDRQVTGDRTERITVARPARVFPPRELTDRPTGAATRTPGVQLDNELRRARILNNREAREEAPRPVITGGAGPLETRPTGAVARPARPVREVEPGREGNEGSRDGNRVPTINDRPVRGERPRTEDVPVRPEVIEQAQPVRSRESSPSERPARPERSDRNDRNDRPAREPENVPVRVERPERHERVEPPARNDPPPRNDPPHRSEPPQRNDPPPRHDPPPRNDPPQRHEPSRSEPSRSEPSRSEPSRSEPSRSEPSRSEPSRSEPSRSEPSRSEPSRSEPSRGGSEDHPAPAKVRDPR